MSGQPDATAEIVIRRTELACPAQNAHRMAKAAASDADQVVFDLEDGTAHSQKVAARDTLVTALTTLDFGAKIRAFRPNGVSTHYFYRDVIHVVEAAGAQVDVMVVPKVAGHEDIYFADRLLSQIEATVGLAPGRIKLEALIESAEAVLHAEAIARASPRMTGLIFGLVDYASDIGSTEVGQEQFFYHHYAKAKTIAAARAAGITCVDGVTLAIRDPEACRRDARMAARMGFDGKWAIHPSQLAIISEAFTPTRAEAEHAARVIAAYERADREQGVGALVVDDQMVDAANLPIERRRLAIARWAGVLADEQGSPP
jgi:citrate lyase subunit beta/citryl-CoA lyase